MRRKTEQSYVGKLIDLRSIDDALDLRKRVISYENRKEDVDGIRYVETMKVQLSPDNRIRSIECCRRSEPEYVTGRDTRFNPEMAKVLDCAIVNSVSEHPYKYDRCNDEMYFYELTGRKLISPRRFNEIIILDELNYEDYCYTAWPHTDDDDRFKYFEVHKEGGDSESAKATSYYAGLSFTEAMIMAEYLFEEISFYIDDEENE